MQTGFFNVSRDSKGRKIVFFPFIEGRSCPNGSSVIWGGFGVSEPVEAPREFDTLDMGDLNLRLLIMLSLSQQNLPRHHFLKVPNQFLLLEL